MSEVIEAGQVMELAPHEAPPRQMQVARTSQAATPADLLRIAVESGADLDRLEKLMDLQDRWEKEQARKAFITAMGQFKSEAPDVIKNKLVSYRTKDGSVTEYMHAELADVCKAACVAMAKYGLSHRWSLEQLDGGCIIVTCIITHSSGHFESTVLRSLPDSSGGKNSIQSIASTVTYLERYTLMAATGLAARGQDDDGQMSDVVQGVDAKPADPTPAERQAARKVAHDAAYGRHSESIVFIKERLAADDIKAAVDEWALIPTADQMALWIAPSKGGSLTTEERKTIKENSGMKEPQA